MLNNVGNNKPIKSVASHNSYTLDPPRRTVTLKLTPMNSGNFLSYLQNSSRMELIDITIDNHLGYNTHSEAYINGVTFKLYNYFENQEIELEQVDYYAAFFCLYLCYSQERIKKYSIEQKKFINLNFITTIFDLFGKQFLQYITEYPEHISIIKLIPEKFKQEYNKLPEFKKVILKHYSDIYGEE